MGLSALRLPRRYSGSVEAIAEPSNESSGKNLSKTERGALDDLADDQESEAKKYGLASTENVTQQHGDDCGNETANVPYRHCDALNGRDMQVAMVANGIELWELAAE